MVQFTLPGTSHSPPAVDRTSVAPDSNAVALEEVTTRMLHALLLHTLLDINLINLLVLVCTCPVCVCVDYTAASCVLREAGRYQESRGEVTSQRPPHTTARGARSCTAGRCFLDDAFLCTSRFTRWRSSSSFVEIDLRFHLPVGAAD